MRRPPRLRPVTSASRALGLILSGLLVPAGLAGSQEAPRLDRSAPLALTRVEGAIALDGRVDEPAWDRIPALTLTNLYPRFNSPLTERTEIRIGYDAEHLYASIRAFDREPHRILANTYYRDRWVGDDEFVIILDTFDDGENAMMFLVTPNGVRVDNLLFHDTEPGRGEWINRDWNTVWDAAATRTAAGWFAELRIPFSSLRFRAVDGRVRMRLKSYRYLRRRNENQMFPATRPEDGANPHFRPSLGQTIVLEGVSGRRAAYLTPTLTSGFFQRFDRTRDPVVRRDDGTAEPSIDVKLPLGSGLSLDLTANTDFAQVEADDQRVNLTRYSLFFPEKRPFFQERSGLFSFSTGGETALFYSRRLGLDAQGQALRILGGARLTGRAGAWDVGALALQTEGGPGNRPENLGVIRVRRGLFGAGNSVGGIVTHRIAEGGRYNLAAGVDAVARLGAHSAVLTLATTASDTATVGAASSLLRGRFQLQRGEGLSYAGEFRWAGRDYEPGLGFVQARDFHDATMRVAYSWRPSRGMMRRIGTIAASEARWRHRDGTAELMTGFVDINGETHGNVGGGVTLRHTREDLPEPLRLDGNLIVPAGRYAATTVTAGVGSPEDRRLQFSTSTTIGGFLGGSRVTVNSEATWTPSPRFELGARLDHTALRFPARGAKLDATITQIRLRLAGSTKVFLDAFAQFNSVRQVVLVNGRLRFNFREGHDLWVVYDETGEDRAGSAIWVPTSRALLVKYSRTLIL